MATTAEWIEGARPRTLPNAIAPVLVGTGAAASLGDAVWWKALLALTVSLALIIGVNFANDYSDGIRGTDDDRVGPMRLVGSGAATPASVKAAASLVWFSPRRRRGGSSSSASCASRVRGSTPEGRSRTGTAGSAKLRSSYSSVLSQC